MGTPMTQGKRNRERTQRERKEAKEGRRDERKARKADLKALRQSGVDPDLAGIVPGPQAPTKF